MAKQEPLGSTHSVKTQYFKETYQWVLYHTNSHFVNV